MARPGFAIAVFASLLFSAAALAQVAPDDLVITGAGLGRGLGHRDRARRLRDGHGNDGLGVDHDRPHRAVSAHLRKRPVQHSAEGHRTASGQRDVPLVQSLLTVHVTTDTEQPLPIVRARVFNSAVPSSVRRDSGLSESDRVAAQLCRLRVSGTAPSAGRLRQSGPAEQGRPAEGRFSSRRSVRTASSSAARPSRRPDSWAVLWFSWTSRRASGSPRSTAARCGSRTRRRDPVGSARDGVRRRRLSVVPGANP